MPKIPNTLVLLAITIAVLFFIGYLWYRKFTGGATEVNGKPLVEPSEYVNLLVGLISLAVAVVFGLVATNLSNKANKYSEASFALANKQDSLHEELNELRNIAIGQQEQLNELLRIVVRLDKQNQLSASQIDELKRVTTNLSQQTDELRALNTKQVKVSENISKQLKISTGILQYNVEKDSKEYEVASKKLTMAVDNIAGYFSDSETLYKQFYSDSEISQNIDLFHSFFKKATELSIKKIEENEDNLILNADYKTFIEWASLSWKINELKTSYKTTLEGKNDVQIAKQLLEIAHDLFTRDIDTFQHNLLQLFQERFEIKPDMFDY